MATTIITKHGTGVPANSSLATGELAVDPTNAKLYSSTNGTDVVEIAAFDGNFDNGSASSPSLTFGGFNTSGLFGFGTTNAYGLAVGGACVMALNPLSGVYFTGGLNSYDPADTDPHIWVRANSLTGMLFYSSIYYVGFYDDLTQKGQIWNDSGLLKYEVTSDYRVKENVVDIDCGLDEG